MVLVKFLIRVLVRVLVVGAVSCALYFAAQNYLLVRQYPEYLVKDINDPSANSLKESGYLPSWLPADAQEIHLQIGLEKNMAWWLRFKSSLASTLISHLGFKPYDQKVVPQLPVNNSFFFKPEENINFYEGQVFFANKKEYMAIKDDVVYYWVQ